MTQKYDQDTAKKASNTVRSTIEAKSNNSPELSNIVGRFLLRKIDRLRKQAEKNNETYHGKEANFTFHGGFNSGYVSGRLSAFEDMADEFGVSIDP